jgi:hypothetical protein
MNPPPRFLEKESSYRYTESRGYHCTNVHITYDDTAAVTLAGRERLELQVIALYCRHPALEKQGFFVAYSHRAKITDIQMESPANSFIDSITAAPQNSKLTKNFRPQFALNSPPAASQQLIYYSLEIG